MGVWGRGTMMRQLDLAGHTMTIASEAAIDAWNTTVEHFLSHGRETAQALAQVFAADPHCPLAWCAKGLFTFLLARGELRGAICDALDGAEESVRRHGATLR